MDTQGNSGRKHGACVIGAKFTEAQKSYIITAKAQFLPNEKIFEVLTSPDWTAIADEEPLKITWVAFRGRMLHLPSKDWEAIRAERVKYLDTIDDIRLSHLSERVKELQKIVDKPSTPVAAKISAIKAIHDMLSEEGRQEATKQSGFTVNLSPERVSRISGFLK